MKNPFRALWEWYAYLQAYLDDAILYTTKKLQDKSKIQTKEDIKNKKITQKAVYYTGVWLSKTVWEWFSWFYEKYKELKQTEINMAQKTIEEDLPKIALKWKQIKEKMNRLWIKSWDIKWLKKLKKDI